jgi:hypothetical protein
VKCTDDCAQCVGVFVVGHMLLNPYRIITIRCAASEEVYSTIQVPSIDMEVPDVWCIDWISDNVQWPFALLPMFIQSLDMQWNLQGCSVMLTMLKFTPNSWDTFRIDECSNHHIVWPTPKKTNKVSWLR